VGVAIVAVVAGARPLAAAAADPAVAYEVVESSGTFAAGEIGTVTGHCPVGMVVAGGTSWVGPPSDPFRFTRFFAPSPDNLGWSERFIDGSAPFTITTRGVCLGEVAGPTPPLRFEVVEVASTFAAGETGTVTGQCPAGMVVIGGTSWVGPPSDPFRFTRFFAPSPDNLGWSERFIDDSAPFTITTRGSCLGVAAPGSPSVRFEVVEVAGTFAAGETGTVTGQCPTGLVVSDGTTWLGTPADPFASTRFFAPAPDNVSWSERFTSSSGPFALTTCACIGAAAPAPPTTSSTTTSTTPTSPATVPPATAPAAPVVARPAFAG
jgi:hypothetical protein